MKLFDPAEGLKSLSGGLRRVMGELCRGPAPALDLRASVNSVQSQHSDMEGSTFGSPEVGSVAANVFMQVVLCLRHAHRVLQVLNSSLSRALSCTVYVNVTALQALGAALDTAASGVASSSLSSGKKAALLEEEQLRVFVRKVLWQMDRADNATRLGRQAGQVGEGEEEEEEEEEGSESEYNDDEDESSQQQVCNEPSLHFPFSQNYVF